ncbi:MAG: ABC transporter substrate-binding protein [Verrucomicrobiota bacterium]|nr:ABC transporter substrate-binding protein [Verrucomicrobiota bacterium]
MKRILALLAATTMLSVGTGCKRGADSAAATTAPEALIFARGADAQKLDPADIDDGESVNSLTPVLEGLVRFRSGSGEIEPALAEAWTISDDGLVYTFTLRQGVTFHDGTPLNAETAVWSFLRQADENHPGHFKDAGFQYWSNLSGTVRDIVAMDDRTIRIRLTTPNAFLLEWFASFPAWLISPESLKAYGRDLVRHPVGTGPYSFTEWRPNEAITYERNPAYWGKKAGFARLVIRSIPDNTVRLLELKAGRIHGLDGVRAAELASLREDPRFTIYHSPGNNLGYLAYNLNIPRLQSTEVRQAIAMAIDRATMVKLSLEGYGVVPEFPLPPGYAGQKNAPAPAVHYDPDAARAILQRHPELLAEPIKIATFSAPRPFFPDPVKIASFIRSDLEKVGLKVEIITRDFDSHLNITRNGDFEIALLGWIGDSPSSDNFLSPLLASWGATKGMATNISFYKNPEFDQLLLAARTTTDSNQRELLYQQALALWARDLPLIPLAVGEQIVVLRSEIKGFELQPTGDLYFNGCWWQR